MTKLKTALGVIGAAYGDEGKGLMTDYLSAATGAPLVVRTNGGAQAGHTVATLDGKRHVFSHIGSGALAGAATHLSRFFVLNPIFFLGERENVASLGGNVVVSADPRAVVTTPFDILVNQIVEESRGTARHGSCGMGFGETIERNLRQDVSITMADLSASRLGMVSKLERIRRDWVPTRLRTLGIGEIPEQFKDILKDDALLRRFMDDCDAFVDAVKPMSDADIANGAIFEGAQGLLLDQDYGTFPHVTRSNTGILNMAAVAREAGIERIDVTYATRAYTTRHGAGALAHETDDMGYASIFDSTNIHNAWQGTIRAAPLDLVVLSQAIRHDMALADGVDLIGTVAVTCLDQVVSGAVVYEGGEATTVPATTLIARIERASGLVVSAVSEGPTRTSITKCGMALAA